ncbi:MAG: hypothetical protein ACTHM0_05770 [Sphingomonas sp.]
MKKLGFVLGAAVALTGCASTQTVLNKQPTLIYHSDQSPTKVAFCLQNKNNVPALDQEDGSKVVLIKNGYGGVAIAFTVRAQGTGTITEVRKQFGIIGAAWKQCIGEPITPEAA